MEPTPEETAGEAIVRILEASNISTVFGIPGSHTLEIYEALRTSGISHVMARHECGATRMAAGYSRTTNAVGVTIVTAGPGATNTITALAEANMASTSLLVITAYEPDPDAFHALENESFLIEALDSVTKEVFVATEGSEIKTHLRAALKEATRGRPGPVALAVPHMVLGDIITSEKEVIAPNTNPEMEHQPQNPNVQPLSAPINAATSPVVLAGQGTLVHRTADELSSLITTLNVPLLCTERALGIVGTGERHYSGIFSASLTHSTAEQALKNADLVVEVGVRKHNHRALEEAVDIPIIGLSDEPLPDGVVGTKVPHLGDAIETVAQTLTPKTVVDDEDSSQIKDILSSKLEERLAETDGLTSGHIVAALAEVAPASAIISADVGDHTNWLYQYWTPSDPYTFLNPDNFMSMGHGLPTAIGAKVGNPERESIALVGDGSLQMNLTEFSVAVTKDLPITVVVSNNSHHGVMSRIQNEKYGISYSVALPRFDYAAFAELCGGDGYTVKDAESLKTTLQMALKTESPTIVDVETVHNVEP